MLSAKARAFSVESLLTKKPLCNGKRKVSETVVDRLDLPCPIASSDAGDCVRAVQQTAADNNVVGEKDLKVELCQNELWQSFHHLGTEMIVTKTGRRMFPALRIKVTGLKPEALYHVSVTFQSVDKNKYRYVYHSSKWMVAGSGDDMLANQSYEHPNSPMTGAYIMSQVTSFEKIKLTNSETPITDQISLVSMQKFQPRIHVTELMNDQKYSKETIVFTFPQTSFIAVTAYQNQEITRLKIARNPFAKGFREANKHRNSLEAMLATLGMLHSTETSVKTNQRLQHNPIYSANHPSKREKMVANKGSIRHPVGKLNYTQATAETVEQRLIAPFNYNHIHYANSHSQFTNRSIPTRTPSFITQPTTFVIHNYTPTVSNLYTNPPHLVFTKFNPTNCMISMSSLNPNQFNATSNNSSIPSFPTVTPL